MSAAVATEISNSVREVPKTLSSVEKTEYLSSIYKSRFQIPWHVIPELQGQENYNLYKSQPRIMHICLDRDEPSKISARRWVEDQITRRGIAREKLPNPEEGLWTPFGLTSISFNGCSSNVINQFGYTFSMAEQYAKTLQFSSRGITAADILKHVFSVTALGPLNFFQMSPNYTSAKKYLMNRGGVVVCEFMNPCHSERRTLGKAGRTQLIAIGTQVSDGNASGLYSSYSQPEIFLGDQNP